MASHTTARDFPTSCLEIPQAAANQKIPRLARVVLLRSGHIRPVKSMFSKKQAMPRKKYAKTALKVVCDGDGC